MIIAGMVIAVVFAGIIATGCSEAGRETLEETAWTLESLADSDGTMEPVIPGSEVTLEFSTGGSFAGSAGCNRYFGSYTAAAGVISTSEIASTEMYCVNKEGVMMQENRYLLLLGTADGYQISGDRLFITGSGGETILVFAKIS